MNFDALARKYRGPAAKVYEARRLDEKWFAELRAVEELVVPVPEGARILDAPVGTGRLIPLLTRTGVEYHGLDVSDDMLEQAKRAAERAGASARLTQGDIRHLPFADDYFDLVACLRFLNWLDEAGVAEVMRELSRVSRDLLLVGVRYFTPLRELKINGSGLVSRAARTVRVGAIHAYRCGLTIHRKDFLNNLFDELRLSVIRSRKVERRWDGTDYVFYLLKVGRR